MAKGSAAAHSKAAVTGMVLIRVFLGLFFLFSAGAKVITFSGSESAGSPTIYPAPTAEPEPGSLSADLFIAELRKVTGPGGAFSDEYNALPVYAEFLRSTVSPNAEIFGWLAIIGEAAVGLFLLIGLLTRLTALIAMLISTVYLLAAMHLFPPLGLAANAAFLAMELSVFISNAGKTAGIDGLLGKRTKRGNN
jgi:uncharacterized membrane protein YphA (DoxX/SURF4 family)